MFRCFFVNRAWALWAWGGLLSMVVLVYVTVQQTVRLNSWYGEFYDVLQKQVNNSFSYLIDRWTDVTELRSIYRRLTEFEKALHPEVATELI